MNKARLQTKHYMTNGDKRYMNKRQYNAEYRHFRNASTVAQWELYNFIYDKCVENGIDVGPKNKPCEGSILDSREKMRKFTDGMIIELYKKGLNFKQEWLSRKNYRFDKQGRKIMYVNGKAKVVKE